MVASAPETPPAPPPAAHVQLSLAGTHGSPGFAFAGQTVTLRGAVSGFAAGQSVLVSVRGAATRTRETRLSIVPAAGGQGRFALRLRLARAGTMSVDVSHTATAGLAAFSATTRLRVRSPNMAAGARGQAVWFLQRTLSRLRYAVPLSGIYEAGTANAVIAYRKMLGLPRLSWSDAGVVMRLLRGAGTFRARFPHDGRHVEADLSKQVLAEVEPHGRVRRIYTTSSGKPSTPTVLGRFQVYLKTPGANSEDMIDSNYFLRGYAIHGYPEVPTWAASHGCLRVPIEDAAAIYAWVRVGTIVDVYY